jgi:hypothetical protein
VGSDAGRRPAPGQSLVPLDAVPLDAVPLDADVLGADGPEAVSVGALRPGVLPLAVSDVEVAVEVPVPAAVGLRGPEAA